MKPLFCDTAHHRIIPPKFLFNAKGYVFVPGNGTQAEQRLTFFKKMTRLYWQSIVFNYERKLAIDAEPLDTAAEQAKRFNDLGDITTN